MSEATFALPHDLEAERAILGAILVDNAQMDAAQQVGLTADRFFRDAHRRIFAALVALSGRRSALDLVTLTHELDRTKDLEEVGGPAYVASVVDGVPLTVNTPHYIGIVQDCATRRDLMRLCGSLVGQASSGEQTADAILDQAVHGLLAISGKAQRGGLVEGPEVVKRVFAYLEEVEQRKGRGSVMGVPTGFAALDHLTNGWQPGHLIVVAGRTSEGKSALALQFAIASESCAYFSCEMGVDELGMRELAVLARVDGWAMLRGVLSSSESSRIARGMDYLAESGVAIDDTPGITLAQVRARARQRQVLYGLNLIVVDYMQLMTAELGKRRESTREQEVAAIARGLKAIAMELRVPVVALSQFNRNLKPGEVPDLHHLRESGEIEQAANVVAIIHRKDGHTVANEGPVDLILAKNRGGPKGTVNLHWYPEQTRFDEVPVEARRPEQSEMYSR